MACHRPTLISQAIGLAKLIESKLKDSKPKFSKPFSNYNNKPNLFMSNPNALKPHSPLTHKGHSLPNLKPILLHQNFLLNAYRKPKYKKDGLRVYLSIMTKNLSSETNDQIADYGVSVYLKHTLHLAASHCLSP